MSVAGSARIPLVDLGAQYQTIRAEVMAAIEAVIERSAFIHGPFVAAFEREMAEFARASHCIGSANGTEAIFVALKALGAGPGDEIITVANTFTATAEAIEWTGARPVLVDVDPSDHLIDPVGRRRGDDGAHGRDRAGPPVRAGRPDAGAQGHRRPARPVHRRGRGAGARRLRGGPAGRDAQPGRHLQLLSRQEPGRLRRRRCRDHQRSGPGARDPTHQRPRARRPLRARRRRLRQPARTASRPRSSR